MTKHSASYADRGIGMTASSVVYPDYPPDPIQLQVELTIIDMCTGYETSQTDYSHQRPISSST